MGTNSKIEWCHHTFNPWIGCTKKSTGCKFCYAEDMMVRRFKKNLWGDEGYRQRTSESKWKEPFKWNRQAKKGGFRFRVFCASFADVFEDREELWDWRLDLFNLIRSTPHLDWLLLTKRPENIRSCLEPYGHELKNIWLGTSIENQQKVKIRIPELLKCEHLAKVLFLSCEPLLEEIDIREYLGTVHEDVIGISRTDQPENETPFHDPWIRGINWVIAGGESGNNARRCQTEWIGSIVKQCWSEEVPSFVKQLGSNSDFKTEHKKGGDIEELPTKLQIRKFPEVK